MTITDDMPPQVVDDSFDIAPTKPKRGRGARKQQADAEPATDRRRGPRVKKDFAKSFTEEVNASEADLAKMRERWERDDTIANAARAKADEQLEAIRLQEAHIAHQKKSPLYQA